MKVKKNKSKRLSISEVDSTYVIVILTNGEWHILQADKWQSDNYLALLFSNCTRGNSLTCRNTRGGHSIIEWFDRCQEMHAFETIEEAFKFLIKKLKKLKKL